MRQPWVGREPVRLIYANPTFPAGMLQRRDFDAHVLEYVALKISALPFQTEKRVFCKFAQHLPSPSLRSGEFKEGDSTTCF